MLLTIYTSISAWLCNNDSFSQTMQHRTASLPFFRPHLWIDELDSRLLLHPPKKLGYSLFGILHHSQIRTKYHESWLGLTSAFVLLYLIICFVYFHTKMHQIYTTILPNSLSLQLYFPPLRNAVFMATFSVCFVSCIANKEHWQIHWQNIKS